MSGHLVERRRLKRTDATKTAQTAIHTLNTLSREHVKVHLSRLEILRTDLRDLDAKIFDLKISEGMTKEQSETEYENCVAYEQNIISAIMTLKDHLEKSRVKMEPEGSPGGGGNTAKDNRRIVNRISIPQLPLPTYSHNEGEDLTKNFCEFEQIIDKYSPSEFEKYVYLKSQISNEPAI